MKVTIKKYEPLPAGTYHMYTKTVNQITNPNPIAGSSGEFLSWTCEVIDDEEYEGKEINFSMSPVFGPSSKGYEFMKALGLEDNSERAVEFDTDDYLGIGFYAKIKVDKNTKNDLVNKFDAIWSEEEQEKILSKFARNQGGRVNSSNPAEAKREVTPPQVRVAQRPTSTNPAEVKREVTPPQVRVGQRPTSTNPDGTKREVTPPQVRVAQRPSAQKLGKNIAPVEDSVEGSENELNDAIDFPE